MAEDSLDDDFGLPATRAELDSSHIRALAVRITNLDEDIKNLRELADKRLPTEDEMKSLREILSDKAGREYLRKQFTKYGLGGLGLLATIYATRAYLSNFLSWLSSVLK